MFTLASILSSGLPLYGLESWIAIEMGSLQLIVSILAFAVLFALFGLRSADHEEMGCGGCQEHGCGPAGCASCSPADPGEFADDGHGVPWRFVKRGEETRTSGAQR